MRAAAVESFQPVWVNKPVKPPSGHVNEFHFRALPAYVEAPRGPDDKSLLRSRSSKTLIAATSTLEGGVLSWVRFLADISIALRSNGLTGHAKARR